MTEREAAQENATDQQAAGTPGISRKAVYEMVWCEPVLKVRPVSASRRATRSAAVLGQRRTRLRPALIWRCSMTSGWRPKTKNTCVLTNEQKGGIA